MILSESRYDCNGFSAYKEENSLNYVVEYLVKKMAIWLFLSGILLYPGEPSITMPTSLYPQQLQSGESFYRHLIADSLDGMLLTDELGLISFVSVSASKILGYETDEMMGKTVFEFVHPEEHSLAVSAFSDEVKKMPRKKIITIRLKKRSGEWIWCMVRGHNLIANPNIGRMVI